MIQVLDLKTEKIVAVFENKPDSALYWNDTHHKSLKNNEETFDFTAQSSAPEAEHLAKRNRVIIPDEDGTFLEFIIVDTAQFGTRGKEVRTIASYTEISKQKIVEPIVLEGQTINTAGQHVLSGTEWQVGLTDYAGIRKVEFLEHTKGLDALRHLATLFSLELRFRIETKGNRITGRYVDFLKRIGINRGKEVVLGKDLLGVTRKENTLNIVTALLCLGPEREDGSRPIVRVEDKEALERWGRNGRHLWDIYIPDSIDGEMTDAHLTELGRAELNKRINASILYEVDAASLEHILGYEHEKARLGDSTRVKDPDFSPPLFLDSRVIAVERSISQKSKKKFFLGEFIERKEADVMKNFLALRSALLQKASAADIQAVKEYAEQVASEAEGTAKEYAEVIVVDAIDQAAEDATTKAGQAEQNAKDYALSEAEAARLAAIQAAAVDAQNKANAVKTELETDIAAKADAEWVNGQLVTKANAADTYTKTEVNNALNSKVSTTTYTTDQQGVVTRLDSAESRITQTEKDIISKVSQTTYDTDINAAGTGLKVKMSAAETSILQNASAIDLRATKTELTNGLSGKADNSTVTALTSRVSTAESQLTVQADEIAARVTKTEFEGLEIGGRNIFKDSNYAKQTAGTSFSISTWGGNVQTGMYDSDVPAGLEGKSEKRICTSSGTGGGYHDRDSFELVSGETYTLSFWIKKTEDTTIGNTTYLAALNRSGDNYYIGLGSFPVTTSWTKVTRTYNITDSTAGIYKRRSILYSPGTIWLSHFKLEKGNKATDWTPAPEDVNSAISGVEGRLTTAESTITQHASSIASKVSQTDFNSLEGRMDSAESSITQQAGEIASKVSTTTYNTGMSSKEDSVYKQTSAPAHSNGRLWLNTSVTPNILYRSTGSAWVKATPTTAAEVGAYSASEGSALAGRLSTAESSITQNANNIALKVSKTDYTGNTIASLINQTATTIKLQAERIDLVGKVKAEHLAVIDLSSITANLGTVTAGMLTGVKIQTSGAEGTVTLENDSVKSVKGSWTTELKGGSLVASVDAGTYVKLNNNGIFAEVDGRSTFTIGSKVVNSLYEAFIWAEENNFHIDVGVSGGNPAAQYYFKNNGDFRTKTVEFEAGTYNKVGSGTGDGVYMFAGSANTYAKMKNDGAFFIVVNGSTKHTFYAGGTKSGGSIVIDGENLGMSPIDSPQILLEYLEFDIPLTSAGTKVYLESRFVKAVENFAVFPNNGKVIEKGPDYFILTGEGTADVRIIGERIGYTDVFFDDIDAANEEVAA